jgi:hypothetical protein
VNSEEPDFMALDAYMRAQLTAAAEMYASGADIDARLQAILERGEGTAHDGPAAVESG